MMVCLSSFLSQSLRVESDCDDDGGEYDEGEGGEGQEMEAERCQSTNSTTPVVLYL